MSPVREKRKEAQMTMTELARRLEMRLPRLSKIETGKQRLLAQEVPAFAAALGCNPVDLIHAQEEVPHV